MVSCFKSTKNAEMDCWVLVTHVEVEMTLNDIGCGYTMLLHGYMSCVCVYKCIIVLGMARFYRIKNVSLLLTHIRIAVCPGIIFFVVILLVVLVLYTACGC